MQGSQATAATGAVRSREASLLLTLLIVDSLHFVFARLLLPHISPAISATYVLAVATLEVGLYGLLRRSIDIRVARTHLWFFVTIGFLIAGSTALNYAAVAYIDAGTAAMLGKMTTLFGLALGLFWLHERLTPTQIGGAALAVAGVFVITFQPVDALRAGALMVVTSTFMYAVHMAIVKRSGGEIDFYNFFLWRLFFTTLFLLAISISRSALELPSADIWPLLIVVGSVDVVISRSLYYIALRRLPMSILSVVLTLSPVAAITWAYLLFGTFPTGQQILGGAAVLAGVLIVTLSRR